MKRLVCMLMGLALMLTMHTALAQEMILRVPADSSVMTATVTELLDAPHADAAVLMNYYPGVRVEVVSEYDNAYVQVNVGDPEGGLMGYMRRADLVFDEESARSVRRVNVQYDTWQACTMYSYMDTLSEVRSGGFMVNSGYVLGFMDDWRHVQNTDGDTGFINVVIEGLSDVDLAYASFMYTRPLESEMSYEEAVALAKEIILEDNRTGANHNMGMGRTSIEGIGQNDLTAEDLDACDVEIDMYYYYGIEQPLHFEISFHDPHGDRYYAWINIWIEGEEMLRYNYGNG